MIKIKIETLVSRGFTGNAIAQAANLRGPELSLVMGGGRLTTAKMELLDAITDRLLVAASLADAEFPGLKLDYSDGRFVKHLADAVDRIKTETAANVAAVESILSGN